MSCSLFIFSWCGIVCWWLNCMVFYFLLRYMLCPYEHQLWLTHVQWALLSHNLWIKSCNWYYKFVITFLFLTYESIRKRHPSYILWWDWQWCGRDHIQWLSLFSSPFSYLNREISFWYPKSHNISCRRQLKSVNFSWRLIIADTIDFLKDNS